MENKISRNVSSCQLRRFCQFYFKKFFSPGTKYSWQSYFRDGNEEKGEWIYEHHAQPRLLEFRQDLSSLSPKLQSEKCIYTCTWSKVQPFSKYLPINTTHNWTKVHSKNTKITLWDESTSLSVLSTFVNIFCEKSHRFATFFFYYYISPIQQGWFFVQNAS